MNELDVSYDKSEIPSNRWFLSHLHAHFENMLDVQRRHRRYGTLLFHKNCDLVCALSSALGRGALGREEKDNGEKTAMHETSQQLSLEQQKKTVAVYLNEKLHQLAKVERDSFNRTPENIGSFDFSAASHDTNRELLDFLSIMTQSVRQRRKLFETSPIEMDQNRHTRNVRLFYALSVLVFCTSATCNTPLHVLVTEAVLCHGGTQELVRILNRLGAAVCLDTVNRLATHVVEKRISKGVLSDLVPECFVAVPIDNIDILQPYGFVSSLDATRSWHGTSVQCTQPLPISGCLTQDDVFPFCLDQQIDSKKRVCSSPAHTPIAKEKHKRRRRTLINHSPHTALVTENLDSSESYSRNFQESCQALPTTEYPNRRTALSLTEFKPDYAEQSALEILQKDIFQSIILRKAGSTLSNQPFPGLQSLIHCVRKQTSEKEVSHITYVQIVSERADCKPTLMGVISRLQKTFVEELGQKYVLVVGDAKTYNLLQSICFEYHSYLKWLIPFPGDWHILYNFQKALMKPYADASLVTLAKVAGHRAETLTSLIQASSFRRTHEFLLQSFNALYRFFMSLYMKHMTDSQQIQGQLDELMSSLIQQFISIRTETDLQLFRDTCTNTMESEQLPLKYSKFVAFMEDLARKNDTVRFCYQFLSVDCFAYIALFTALRYRNWELRTGSLKLLAAVFSAFDRPTYQELIPRHLKDLLTMPPSVLHHLQKGSFSIRLSPSEWHAVALDECHEMKINRDAKFAVIHPSKHKMEFLSNYMGFRSECVQNLKRELFPEKDKKRETNIRQMMQKMQEKCMIALPSNGLWNFLEGKEATSEQAHELFNFRQIGRESFERYICKMIGSPSVNAPNRKKRLVTFSVTKLHNQRVKQVEKERQLSERYLKKQLAWINEKGLKHIDLESLLGPISPLPRALIGENQLPYKGNKSSATQYIIKRYSTFPVMIEYPPPQWVPHAAILEGMFMIQTSPLPSMSCMREYAELLLTQYARLHFQAGALEVHVVFDSPGSMV